VAKTNFKVKSNVSKITDEINEAAEDKVEEAVLEVRNEVIETLTGQRSGEEYPVPSGNPSARTRLGDRVVIRNAQGVLTDSSGKRFYTASAPGEPPASRTGLLRSTIGWYVSSERSLLGKKVVGTVGSPLEYAVSLEKGIGMAPRRFMHPSFLRSRDKVKRILGSRWL